MKEPKPACADWSVLWTTENRITIKKKIEKTKKGRFVVSYSRIEMLLFPSLLLSFFLVFVGLSADKNIKN